jgi:hypothetical protein
MWWRSRWPLGQAKEASCTAFSRPPLPTLKQLLRPRHSCGFVWGEACIAVNTLATGPSGGTVCSLLILGWIFIGQAIAILFFIVFFGAPKGIFYVLCTVSGCDSGNRNRNIAVCTWRLSPQSYGRHPWASAITLPATAVTLELQSSPLSYGRHPKTTAMAMALFGPWPDLSMLPAEVIIIVVSSSAAEPVVGRHSGLQSSTK